MRGGAMVFQVALGPMLMKQNPVWGPSPAHLTWARLLLVRRLLQPNPTFLAFPQDTGVPASVCSATLSPRPLTCLRIWTQFPLRVCPHISTYWLTLPPQKGSLGLSGGVHVFPVPYSPSAFRTSHTKNGSQHKMQREGLYFAKQNVVSTDLGMIQQEWSSSHLTKQVISLVALLTLRGARVATCWAGTGDTVHGTKGSVDVISSRGQRTQEASLGVGGADKGLQRKLFSPH